jgi:hypothetical protein
VNVGWFPLGPREVFVPSYPVSRVYVNNVNISNTTVNQTVINNYYNTTIVNKTVTVNNVTYVNQRVAGAVTVTSPHAFTSAQPVGRNIVAVNQSEVAAAPAAVRAPAVVPPKQAVLGAGAATNVHPPATVQNRAVVAKNTPPPPPPSFATRQAAIEKNQGRPISMVQERQISAGSQAGTPQVKNAPPASPGTPHYNAQGTASNGNNMPGPLNTNRPANNGAQTNGTGNRPANARSYEDRPQTARPGGTSVNTQLEQKHQQQIQQLQQKQDQEYQKLQQKQNVEQQQLQQKNAGTQTQQQVQQKQQQQLEQLQQKQQQQQQNLKQKQEADHAKAYKETPKSKPADDKPHK